MKKTIIPLLLAAFCLCWPGMVGMEAKVNLPSILSDNMVLQQETDAALWGTAAPGAKVRIKVGWDRKAKYSVKADSETGKWFVRVTTPSAGGPYEIVISDGEAVTLKNILIGEVWFCSGQSNMEMPMKGYPFQPVAGSEDVIVSAKASRPIRICNVEKQSSIVPMDTCNAKWSENTPDAVAETSATAYYFADVLQRAIDIPVGIIVSCWGGSTMHTWLSREILQKEFPFFEMRHLDGTIPVKGAFQDACLLYNGQVLPLAPFTFKGIVWYQGESDLYTPERYIAMQKRYVEMMRGLFEVPDAPFYYVQIAPFNFGDANGDLRGKFVVAQQRFLNMIPHTGMASTCDLGECDVVHYRLKKDVGKRLAFLALAHDYGFGNALEADAPTFKEAVFSGEKATVTFNVRNGLTPWGEDLMGFELAGDDKVFHKAQARMVGTEIVEVRSEEVPAPVAVRYCFRNWCKGNLYNCSGIPATPFRSDNW
jgi:Domain of unknown function (DUF303).